MIFISLFIIPTIISLIIFWISSNKITWKEYLVQLAAQTLVVGASVVIIHQQNVADVEIWNGSVINKVKEKVHCRHSYQCNCHPVCHTVPKAKGGATTTCTTHCSTCYRHSYDIDWDVHTNLGRTISIARMDSQGLIEPPRWTRVIVGEPVSIPHNYDNYLKSSSGTLFKKQGLVEKYAKYLPDYPGQVYDYYRLDRVIGSVPDPGKWNKRLSEINAEIGVKRQANAILVVTEHPQEFSFALEQHWLGGKKNDVVVVVGVTGAHDIAWARVIAWTDEEIFKIRLRDAIVGMGTMDIGVLELIHSHVMSGYVRKPMGDFSYLSAAIVPTTAQYLTALMVSLVVSAALSVLFWRVEAFE